MDEIAEYGIAAHALYKDGVGSPTELLSRESSAYAWLRRTIELLAEGANPEEFLEHTKLELFHDQVFCFTPKGKLIALPRGPMPSTSPMRCIPTSATPRSARKINGKIAPLISELVNGDEVEIITSKAQAAPPAAWESPGRRPARRARRSGGRHARRCAINMPGSGAASSSSCASAPRSPIPTRSCRVRCHGWRARRSTRCCRRSGRGEMRAADVVRAMYPDYKEERAAAIGTGQAGQRLVRLQAAKGVKYQVPGPVVRRTGAIPIRGINGDLPVRFAPNGGAVPGDRIVGILTPGEGITIYPIQSPALSDFEDAPERWIDLRWDMDERAPQRFPARIQLKTVNEPGSLAQVAPPAEDRQPIPAAAYNVAAQLLAVEEGIDSNPPTARVHVSEGFWMTVRAARLDGQGSAREQDIAVTFEESSAAERVDLFCRAHGLTARERELIDQLVSGRDTREIARRMFLSENTVQDHLKSIFAKTVTRSRRTLLSRALGS